MFKNISIGQITIILTLFLAILNISILFVLYSTGDALAISIELWIILLILSLVFTYVIVKFFLEFFVFRKIKVIYKMISDSKQSKSLKGGENIKERNLIEVNDEVIEWAEKQENEMDYLVRLEQYRKNFLGNISHELKTPLFAIQGYLITLIEGGLYDENINMKYLKRAVYNSDRLQKIVEDLEIINQFESGNIVLNLENFDIRELSEEVIEDLSFQADAREVELSLKDGAKSKFKVHADREKVRQVLNNLVTNSIKYGIKGGKVRIGFYDLDESVLIEVGDNGVGIAEEHLNHLFDRFYRVDSSRNRKAGGSGLGLSIVKHILEAHNQTISVRSTEGEGSTFGFTLSKA